MGVEGKKLKREVSISEMLPIIKKKKKVALHYHLYTKCASCEFCSGFHSYNNSKKICTLDFVTKIFYYAKPN